MNGFEEIMMNKNITGLTSIIMLLLITQLYSPQASANNTAKDICEYVAANDKKRLRSLLKTQRIKIRSIFGDVTCNGKNLLMFAAISNADKVGEMIIRNCQKKYYAH